MATTEAVFKLRVDTGNSVNDVEKLTTAVEETQTVASSGKGLTDFEAKLNQLDKTLAEGNLTMRQRTKLVKEYQTIAAQSGEQTPIGDRAVRSAAALKDEIGDLNQRVTLLSSDTVKLDTALSGIEVGASAFQGVTSAIALTGIENEDLIASMNRLIAVQGVVNSIQVITNKLNKDAILGIQLRVALEKAKNFIMTGSIASTTALATAEGGLTVATNTATFATKAFRAALIATGIGAIIVLIGTLIANFDKVTKVVKGASEQVLKAYDYFNKLGTGVKVLIGIFFPFIGVIYGAIKALEYFNIIDTKNERDMSARHEDNIKRIDKELARREKQKEQRQKQFEQEQANGQREIALLQAQGKSTVELEKAQIKRSLANQKALLEELRINQRILQATNVGGINDVLISENAKAIEETRQAYLDSVNELEILRIEAGKKEVKHKKDVNKEKLLSDQELYKMQQAELKRQNEAELNAIIQSEKNIIQAENDYLMQIELIQEENRKRLLTDQQVEIEAVNEKYFALLEQAKENAEQTLIIETAKANEINDINLKYGQEQLEANKKLAEEQKKIDKEKADNAIKQIERVLSITQSFATATSALNQLLNTSDNERLKQAKGNEAEELKIKKRIFERDKKMKIAQTAIDTASNVVRSITNGGGIPFGLPFGILAAATGALQISAISKQTFDGGSSGTSSFNTAPATTSAQPTQANQTTLNEPTAKEAPTTKVIVLESDITKIQQRVKVAESLSGF